MQTDDYFVKNFLTIVLRHIFPVAAATILAVHIAIITSMPGHLKSYSRASYLLLQFFFYSLLFIKLWSTIAL